jgi:hypothetical protein
MEPASHGNGSIADLRWMPAMRFLKYLLVAVTLVGWVAGLLLAYVPGYSEWPFYFAAGCYLTVVVCALSAFFRRKWRSLAVFALPFGRAGPSGTAKSVASCDGISHSRLAS